jgi:hypothetical protein
VPHPEDPASAWSGNRKFRKRRDRAVKPYVDLIPQCSSYLPGAILLFMYVRFYD